MHSFANVQFLLHSFLSFVEEPPFEHASIPCECSTFPVWCLLWNYVWTVRKLCTGRGWHQLLCEGAALVSKPVFFGGVPTNPTSWQCAD